MGQLFSTRNFDDAHYSDVLPTLYRQPGLAELRLARILNDVQAPGQCVPRRPWGITQNAKATTRDAKAVILLNSVIIAGISN